MHTKKKHLRVPDFYTLVCFWSCSYLYELNDAIGDGRLAEFLQVLDDIRGLQANAHSSIQRVGGQFILVHVTGPADRLSDGHQKVLSILIDR